MVKKVDATTRAVLDQLRTIIIWAVFLIPFGPSLCRVQQYFDFTAVKEILAKLPHPPPLFQPIGLVIMVAGVWIFNDIIIMPLVRRFILKSESS